MMKGRDPKNLDQRLLAAHEARDHDALVGLYSEAAAQSEAAGDIEAACFYLTHAFVYALETGAPAADQLNAQLSARGRAHRIAF